VAEAQAGGARVRGAVSEQIHVTRVRLQRALVNEEWPLAEHESGILLALLSSTDGEYVTWLANLRRKLQLRYGSDGRKS
jgi:hypothetical protein